jgi:hypothetical protein
MTIPSVNTAQTQLDKTVRIFDRFYNFELSVPANEYDVLYSFFFRLSGNKDSAQNFAYAVFRIADQQGIPAIVLLDEFVGKTQLDVTALIAYYLNEIRSSSTMIGVQSQVTPNYYAARNVQI